MSSTLWVRVYSAQVDVDEPEPCTLQVRVRVGGQSRSTSKILSSSPHWNEDLKFEVSDLSADLLVELFRYKFVFSNELLGSTCTPLYTIRRSNTSGDGQWSCLLLPSPSEPSQKIPTKHLVQFDTRFEFPEEIPFEVAEALEAKLQTLNDILEKEVEAIENQHYSMVVGELSLPTTTATISYSYPRTEYATSYISASSESPPSYYTPPHSSPSHSSFHLPPSQSPHHLTPSQSPSHLPRSQSPSHLTPSQSHLSISHSSSISSINSSSGGGGGGGEGGGGFLRIYGRHGRISPSVREEEQLVAKRGLAQRKKWRGVVSSENFQDMMQQMKSERGATDSVKWTSALADLVNQLTTFKEKKYGVGQNVKSFITVNQDFRTRSRSVIDTKHKRLKDRHALDEGMGMLVYKNTLGALVYPISEPDSHQFEKWSAHRPTSCSECQSLLWGLTKQGVKCKNCGKICHERCASMVNQECFRVYTHASSSDGDTHLMAITDKMHRTVVNHGSMFRLIRDAFEVPDAEHQQALEEVQQRILSMTRDFNAQVKVKVLAAQGLNFRKMGEKDRKIYVTVGVGSCKRRTRTFKEEGNPQWNEQFTFSCNNYHESIRIRVWCESHSPLAKVAHRLTNEGDIFLGEKIIEVRRVGPPRDVWYHLEKRTQEGSVSGSLSLNLSAVVQGENEVVPYYEQYMKLHEQLFIYLHLNLNFPLMMKGPEHEEESSQLIMLPNVAQEISDEFALRYCVEPVYRLMVHFSLLVHHHSFRSALTAMDDLLKRLKHRVFMHLAADNSVRAVGATQLLEEFFDSANFGRDNFARLLEKLVASLRIDLQQYREFYPSNDEEKLEELEETVKLMATVLTFQKQAMGIVTSGMSGKLDDMVQDSMKECVKNTFDFIVQNTVPEGSSGHPALLTDRKPFEFFQELMNQIRCVVYEDRTVYTPIISKYCGFNFGDVSALEMWHLFSTTIEHLFEDEATLSVFVPKEYIHLYISVKSHYDEVVGPIPSQRLVLPDYPMWFIPCIRKWLQEYQKNAEDYVEKAWEDDKESLGFALYEEQPYSNSVYQMFFFLHKGFEAVNGLEADNFRAKQLHFHSLALVVREVVQIYVDRIAMHLPECVGNLQRACMLLNNLQALRVSVQALYEEMGGSEKAGPGCTEVLNEFQTNVLSQELTSWCVFVARSLTPCVKQAVVELQAEIIKLKGQSGLEREDIKKVVTPLLDMLTKKALVTIAANCRDLVLQKVVKEVWYVVLEALHQMLLPMLKVEQDGAHAHPVRFAMHYYTNRQCAAVEKALDMLKEVFLGGEQAGLKQSLMDRGIKQLQKAITYYRRSTDQLITEFFLDTLSSGHKCVDVPCGEVSLEVNTYYHPATRELEGTVRVISATGLKPVSGGLKALRPFVELNWVLPQPPTSTETKRRFTTHHKSGTLSPSFNEAFKFTVNAWEENCELQVTVRSRTSFGFGADRIIGVGVVPLATILKGSHLIVELGSEITVSDRGQAILNVLSVRQSDDWAQAFVALKTQQIKGQGEDPPMSS